MRVIVQNVKDAKLSISNQLYAVIDQGYVLLIGFKDEDNETIVDKMIDKILKVRLFQDDKGKTNLSIIDIEGAILAVPQFTLYADLTGGRRPSFTKALAPERANLLFDYFVVQLKKLYKQVEFGVFGADMKVNLTNDGPFTIILDSEELFT